MTAQELAERLKARRQGNGWMARCPVHDDRDASLSIHVGSDGRILLHCFAGCTVGSICSSIGICLSDLFPSRRPASLPSVAAPREHSDSRQAKRTRWPLLDKPTPAELRQIAELRNLSDTGLLLAVQRGLLWCAYHTGVRCFVITDSSRRIAQARRLDGRRFLHHGKEKKALNLPGSEATLPVGLPEAASFPVVLLVEGGPDLLAAFHFIHCEGRELDTHAVAVLGSQQIDENSLPQFAGKRVRLFPHVDADWKGRIAAAKWTRSLLPLVSMIDGIDFGGYRKLDGDPVNDLNDLCFIDPDNFEGDDALSNLCPPPAYAWDS